MCRNRFGDERDNVIAAPAEIFLQFRRVRCPHTIEAQGTVVTAVSCGGGIATLQSEICCVSYDRATEATASIEIKLVVPISRQRQFEFELVLWSRIARHVAVAPNRTWTARNRACIA